MQSSLFPTLVILSLLVAITFLRPIHAQDEIDQEDDAADSFADDIDIEESPRYKRLSNVGINLKPLEFIKKDDDEIENARIKKVAPQDDGDSFRSDPGMAGLNQDDDDDLGLSGKNSKPQKDHKDKIHKANDLSTVPQGLGESCNSHNAERITNYLENVDQSDDQAALDGVMDLVSGPPDKSFCDYRQFLTCRNEICEYWTSGVIEKIPVGSKTTYIIESGQNCGGISYPKYFDTRVQLQCINEDGTYCSKSTPKICPCSKTDPNCAQTNEVARPKSKPHKKKHEESMQADYRGYGPSSYGQRCTQFYACSSVDHMTCQPDHFSMRVAQIQQDSFADQDHLAFHDYDASAQIQEDEDYEAQMRGLYQQAPKKHFRCRCDTGWAPYIQSNGFISCKVAAGHQCENSTYCASHHCIGHKCNLPNKFLFFININDHLLVTKPNGGGTGLSANVDSGAVHDKPLKLLMSLFIPIVELQMFWYIFWDQE